MPVICKHTAAIPIEFTAGLFSMFPDTPWISHCVANNSRGELRSVGAVALPQEAFSPASSCSLHFAADVDCTLEIFQLLSDFEPSHHTPTWNSMSADRKWHTPGGISETDARFLGVVQIQAGQTGEMTGKNLTDGLVSGVNDGKSNHLPCLGLLIRRRDMGIQTVNIDGKLKIESDN